MRNKYILLVEDNEQDEFLTLRALKKNNITNEVIVVRDGEEALDYLFCTGKFLGRDPFIMPEVIFLDLKIPKIDGLEVLKRLRAKQELKLIPVVVLSTSIQALDIQKSYELGANSYIRKPVDYEEFSESIKGIATYWLFLNITVP